MCILAKRLIIVLTTLWVSTTLVFAQDGGDTPPQPIDAGQNIRFTHLSLDDGLSQTTVWTILQDSRGFMWFGTQDGLNRYDGYNFVVYRNDPSNLNSLSGNIIIALHEDSNGNLWIGTEVNGLNRFDPATDTFARYRHDPLNLESIGHNNVNDITEDETGVLWVATLGGGLNRFDPATEVFTRYQHDPEDEATISSNEVKSVLALSTDEFWLATSTGVDRFNPQTEVFTHYLGDPDLPGDLIENHFHTVYQDSWGDLWFGGGNARSLYHFERETETVSHYQHDPDDPTSLSAPRVETILEDSFGNLWIGTWTGGLNRFNPETDQFTRFEPDSTDPFSLNDDDVLSIYEDRSGVLWLGTNGGGINKLDQQSLQFTHYQNDPDNPNSLSSSYIYTIYEDEEGILWVGGDDGVLNRFDRDTQQVTRYEPDPEDPQKLNSSFSISAITEDRQGLLWIGTWGGGLHSFDRETELFRRYPPDPDDPQRLGDNVILSIYEDQSGVLWIGTLRAGLHRFDRQTGQFERFQHDSDDPSSIDSNAVRVIYEDSMGILWLGTLEGGLNQFDATTETFVHYQHNPDDISSLSHYDVYSIHDDQSGRVWVGTPSGLNQFDRERGTFIHYSEKDGLPNSVIYGILEDDAGHLWLSTNKGISQFDPHTGHFQNYGVMHGLQSDEFNQTAYFQSASGEMFFGGINGLNAFYPNQITTNPYVPPVILTDFRLFNEPVPIGAESILEHPIWAMDKITLSHDQNTISFEVAALSYSDPDHNQYRYRLEGFDDKWITVGSTRRFVTYTALPPSNYTLRIQGSNNDGVWNEEGVALNIIIKPPWWKTWWAYGLCGLLAVAAVGGLVQWRIRRVSSEKHRLEKEIEQQQRVSHERERLLQQIQEKARQVQQIIDTVPEGVVLLDRDQRIVSASPAAVEYLATLADAQVGDVLTDLGNIPLEDFLDLPPQRAWRDVHIKNGAALSYEVIAQPIYEEPASDGWVLVLRDVTQEREIEQRLEQQARLAVVGQLAAGIAHDFNNILSVITLRTQLIQFESNLADKTKQDLRVILRQVEHATNLIQQILDFGRRAVIERQALNLLILVKEQVKFLERALPENVNISVHYGNDKYITIADPTRIQQVIMNLVVNARDALAYGGAIQINLARATLDEETAPLPHMAGHEWVEMKVADTGTGIPPDVLPHIFDPFTSTKAPGKGTGLGLAQVHGIVEQHAGHIEVDTEIGEGTTFTIYLSAAPEAADEKIFISSQALVHGEQELILVVEDNPETRAALKHSLKQLNYRVFETHNGREALTVWEEHREEIKVVLSDVVMPEMGGIDLFFGLIEQDEAVKVVLVTGHLLAEHMDHQMEHLKARGLVGWLKKPYSLERLAQILALALGKGDPKLH